MGWQKSTGLLVYGPEFKQTRYDFPSTISSHRLSMMRRKIFHQELGSASAIRAFWPQEEYHARKFLELCTDHPERLVDNCFQFVV